MTAAEFKAFVASETAKFAGIIEQRQDQAGELSGADRLVAARPSRSAMMRQLIAVQRPQTEDRHGRHHAEEQAHRRRAFACRAPGRDGVAEDAFPGCEVKTLLFDPKTG